MANLGNKYQFGSLSNCFGVAPPEDSYGGILRTDEEIAQLMKRRGGVGLCPLILLDLQELVSPMLLEVLLVFQLMQKDTLILQEK
jgi:hypothetical protein